MWSHKRERKKTVQTSKQSTHCKRESQKQTNKNKTETPIDLDTYRTQMYSHLILYMNSLMKQKMRLNWYFSVQYIIKYKIELLKINIIFKIKSLMNRLNNRVDKPKERNSGLGDIFEEIMHYAV